ncbi:hypothetical protein A3709_16465 [Halioglobus sp. HI00S01]|uniref:M20/M25/M40 family metallo-hydrolase n=1 Tax=Halioglobus sp. HI00S01 TaxID=1822214 RepID=UPI0007C3297A|nr:M20/M25/M40 family metallo-hydrolase [Halioglobus sp. HI00S01]KZX59143.1 hypothetical protein A3709_16465 [Halioglobus sp. HI00S01]
MIRLVFTAFALVSALGAQAAEPIRSHHAVRTLDIYRHIIEIDTSKSKGNTVPVAQYLADQLTAGGLPKEDVEVVELFGFGALVARYRGDGSSGKKPILFLGHMDVVEALAEDWERPPFKLTEDEKNFYARGTVDNKFGIAQLTSTFIRLKEEGFVPDRDLILVFTGDEESAMVTTRYFAQKRPDILEAEYALNSDAGRGELNAKGDPIVYAVQAAEKTYSTWEITATNPGGHSSRPRLDNAIYDLASAITNIQGYRFPVQWSEMTRAYFKETGELIGGELGEAMIAFSYDPNNEQASDRLFRESSYVGSTRTTCVVTMLRAGHAENALPQSATATVNCRIFPGTSAAEVEEVLKEVVANDGIQFELLTDVIESPVSSPREDVMLAVTKAVYSRYPGIRVMPYMESGGTDGMHFRRAGIPTWAVSGIFMNPDEMFAHGLNERVPKATFYGALDHWSIIIRELTGGAE